MTYKLDFTRQAQDDIDFHKKTNNKPILRKISVLLNELSEHPLSGTGKPEPLKHQLTGLWARRINREHRMVYEVIQGRVVVHRLRGHYLKI